MPRPPRTKPHLDFLRRELHRHRVEQGVTIEQLAEAAGYKGTGHLSRWLDGAEGVDMAISRVQLLAARLGYDITLTGKE